MIVRICTFNCKHSASIVCRHLASNTFQAAAVSAQTAAAASSCPGSKRNKLPIFSLHCLVDSEIQIAMHPFRTQSKDKQIEQVGPCDGRLSHGMISRSGTVHTLLMTLDTVLMTGPGLVKWGFVVSLGRDGGPGTGAATAPAHQAPRQRHAHPQAPHGQRHQGTAHPTRRVQRRWGGSTPTTPLLSVGDANGVRLP